jgi:hypothetical protein
MAKNEKREWIIWSIEHTAWWAPAERGYTKDRTEAGCYTYEQALAILRGANMGLDPEDPPSEAMVKIPS